MLLGVWNNLKDAIVCTGEDHNNLLLFSLTTKKYCSVSKDDIEKCDERLGLCEIVKDNTARPCFDIDYNIGDIMDKIERCIKGYISKEYGVEVECMWKVSKDENHIGYHLIVNGIYYKRCWSEGCKILADLLYEKLNINVDRSVYRPNGGLRLPGQLKPVDGILKRKLVPIGNRDYKDYILSHDRDKCVIIRTTCICKCIYDNRPPVRIEYLPTFPGLLLKEYKNGLYIYRNVGRGWFCKICRREHNSDNAFAYVTRRRTLIFKCHRNMSERGKHAGAIEYILPDEAFLT